MANKGRKMMKVLLVTEDNNQDLPSITQ